MHLFLASEVGDTACLQHDEVQYIGNYWKMLSNMDFSVHDVFIDQWDLLYGRYPYMWVSDPLYVDRKRDTK